MHIIDRLLETACCDTQRQQDREAKGDLPALVHTVDFCLGTDDEARARTVCSFINDNCYGRAHVEGGEGVFRVVTIVETPLTQNIICSLSAHMVHLSYLFKVEYIGWGSWIETGSA